jgi:hypothetical protein
MDQHHTPDTARRRRSRRGALALGLAALAGSAGISLATASPAAAWVDCVGWSSYQYSDHTNVYLDNHCGRNVTVKVFMANGTDSHCISLNGGVIDQKWRSNAHPGYSYPWVEDIKYC